MRPGRFEVEVRAEAPSAAVWLRSLFVFLSNDVLSPLIIFCEIAFGNLGPTAAERRVFIDERLPHPG